MHSLLPGKGGARLLVVIAALAPISAHADVVDHHGGLPTFDVEPPEFTPGTDPTVPGRTGGGPSDPFAHHINPSPSVDVMPRLPVPPPGPTVGAPRPWSGLPEWRIEPDARWERDLGRPVPGPGTLVLIGVWALGRRRRRSAPDADGRRPGSPGRRAHGL